MLHSSCVLFQTLTLKDTSKYGTFVNGERVISVSDTAIDRGTVGVDVAAAAPGQTTEARFDNIAVTAPR